MRWIAEDGWVLAGLAGVFVFFLSCAMLHAITIPPLASADEALHLDYAWRVAHLELPRFEEPPSVEVGVPTPGVQWVYHHPPLYYGLLAPVAGPLLERGHWVVATGVGRGMTILMGMATLLALAWATSVITRGWNRRRLLVVGVPAIASAITPFIGASSAIYNDVLVVFWGTLVLGVAARIVANGITRADLAWLAALSVAGAATRASFVSSFLVATIAIVIAAVAQSSSRDHHWQAILRAGRLVAVPGLVVVLGIGWFYLRNYVLSGSWVGGQYGWAQEHLGRVTKPMPVALGDPSNWFHVSRGLFGRHGTVLSKVAVAAAALPLVIRFRTVRSLNWERIAIPMLLIIQFVMIVLLQLMHFSRGGALNARYYLGALLPIALFLASGLSLPDRSYGLPLIGFMGVGAWALVAKLVSQGEELVPLIEWVPSMTRAAGGHGLAGLVHVCLIGVGVSMALLVIVMPRLSEATPSATTEDGSG